MLFNRLSDIALAAPSLESQSVPSLGHKRSFASISAQIE
jgi:hypothetical protein